MPEPKDDPFSPPPDWNFRPPKRMGGLLDPSTFSQPRLPQTGLLAGPPPANTNRPPAPPQATPSYSFSGEDQDYHGRNRGPVLETEAERRKSILENTPGLFQVEDNRDASGTQPGYALSGLGVDAVRNYDSLIEEESKRAGVDPNLARATMYMEASQGWYGYPAEALGFADSIFPMNVRRSLWGALIDNQQHYRPAGKGPGYYVDDFDNPRLNIRAGVTLLKRIEDRLENPTIRNIATLYNLLGKNKVTDYGARVERIYQTREWNHVGPGGKGAPGAGDPLRR